MDCLVKVEVPEMTVSQSMSLKAEVTPITMPLPPTSLKYSLLQTFVHNNVTSTDCSDNNLTNRHWKCAVTLNAHNARLIFMHNSMVLHSVLYV